MARMFKIYTIIAILFISNTLFAAGIEMSSSDFLDKGVLPVLYTCDGKGVPPQLTWGASAKDIKSFMLIMTSTDKENEPKYHWILYNIPPSLKELPELMSKIPTGSQIAKNSWGNTNYQSPCPDRGSAQSYIFTLYALNNKVDLKPDSSPESILTQIKSNIIETGSITAIYSRWPVPLN